MNDDLAGLFGDPPEQPSQDVRYRQGVVITFNKDTLENTVNVGGTVLTDLTVLSTGDVRLLIPGAVVGVLAVGTTTKTLFITGRILIPGTPEAASAVIPGTPGTVASFAGTGSPPVGWLVCDGSAVSRTTYADLFSAIGTTWGAGNGTTTFNLPDLRDRVYIGAGITYSVGNTGGATTHTHTNSNTGSESAHTHTQANTGAEASHTHTQGNTGSESSHTHSIPQGTDSTSNVGGTFVVTVSNQTHTHGGTNSGSSHSHTNPTTAAGSSHAHTNPTSDAGSSHNHTQAATGSTGNLPPYAALTPIIRY